MSEQRWPERVKVYRCPDCEMWHFRDDFWCACMGDGETREARDYIPTESVQAVAERWREQAREFIFTCNTSKLNPHENKVTYGKAQGLREAADQLILFCNRGE